MKEYVNKDDLPLINFVLERGAQVLISKDEEVVIIHSADKKAVSTKKIDDLQEM